MDIDDDSDDEYSYGNAYSGSDEDEYTSYGGARYYVDDDSDDRKPKQYPLGKSTCHCHLCFNSRSIIISIQEVCNPRLYLRLEGLGFRV